MRDSLQLITLALQKLNVSGAGQNPSAEDVQIVRDQLVPLIEELALKTVVYITDLEEIPEKYFLALADRVAQEVAPYFGLGAVDPNIKLATENRLRRMWAMRATYGTLRTSYF